MKLSVNPCRNAPLQKENDAAQIAGNQKIIGGSDAELRPGVDRGKLYSLKRAINLPTENQLPENFPAISRKESQTVLNNKEGHSQIWEKGKNVLEASKEMAADIRGGLFQMKDKVIDKLTALQVPAESLENARSSIESIVRDATHAAYGMTKDAVQRIRLRLVEILPSLSPNETRKIVDDVEREVLGMPDAAVNIETASENIQKTRGVSSATASALPSDRPETPSQLSSNVNRIRSWALRSRL